jgi:apolipoprotein D and lipocalin family protein
MFRLLLITLFLTGCASLEPIRTAEQVDLNKFSGDWFVIAAIPTIIETNAYNAVETYEPPRDGKIATTFRFNEGGFDGEEKVYNPTGFLTDNNAVWGMQFVWPIKAEYRIVYISDDYSTTIIGRRKRDYVWIMARSPSLPPEQYDALLKIVREEGYDLSKLREVPHEQTNQIIN